MEGCINGSTVAVKGTNSLWNCVLKRKRVFLYSSVFVTHWVSLLVIFLSCFAYEIQNITINFNGPWILPDLRCLPDKVMRKNSSQGVFFHIYWLEKHRIRWIKPSQVLWYIILIIRLEKYFPGSSSNLSLSGHLQMMKWLQCGKMFSYCGIIKHSFANLYYLFVYWNQRLFLWQGLDWATTTGFTTMLKGLVNHLLAFCHAPASSKK